MNKLAQYLRTLVFEDSQNQEHYSKWLSQPVFTSELKTKPQSKCLPFNFERWDQHYLPIEDFKKDGERIFQFNKKNITPQRVFHSSGTTSEAVSKSYFSKDGLTFYKAEALRTFYEVLASCSNIDPLSFQGYSLIPPTSDWPNSSLAQMLEWLGEFWNLTYITMEDWLRNADFFRNKSEKPLWIFATAVHWMDLLEQDTPLYLPKNSLLFETGGSKKSGKDYTKQELYSMITSFFELPERNLISEYGMCELACQAYDFISQTSSERIGFRFPSWVKVSTMEGLGEFKPSGRGALLVSDPYRVDYPLPIRTQDIVNLSLGGSFTYEKRSKFAPLKGCSLLVEDLKNIKRKNIQNQKIPQWNQGDHKQKIEQPELMEEKIACILDILKNSRYISSLQNEFISPNVAQSALDDLFASFPTTKKDWEKAIQTSKFSSEKTYCIILPNNHSIVGIFPLAIAFLAHVRVLIRLPKTRFPALEFFIKSLQHHGAVFSFLPNAFRLGNEALPEAIDHLLIYGEDSTIHQLQEIFPGSVSGYGNFLSISAVGNAPDFLLLSKDAFSLDQKGCLSSRLLLIPESAANDAFFHNLEEASRKFFGKELPLEYRIALDHEEIQFSRKKIKFYPRKSLDSPLFPIYRRENLQKLWDALSSIPCIFPVVVYKNESSLLEELHQLPPNTQVSIDPHFPLIPGKSIPLGKANVRVNA